MAEAFNPLDTLRQAFNPKDDVKFELKVNEHPKGHTNKSIVNAINMKLSDDGVVLENDNKIEEVDAITTALNNRYGNNRKIVHVLSCNRELVLFVARDMNAPLYTTGVIDIWRYSEESNTIDIFYSKGIPWYGGKFSSAFTYTSNNSLIIAFCEYDSIVFNKTYDCPLRTINLGDFSKSTNIFNDRDIEPYKTPLCPEVCLPKINYDSLITGSLYKGVYHFYIRYKINKYDYTQWYNFGYPIVLDKQTEKTINKKLTYNDINKDFNGEELKGAFPTTSINNLLINISSDTDIANSCINININHDSILYEYFDLGIICVSNTYTKYFIKENIKLSSNNSIDISLDTIKEEQFNVSEYHNFYNVKNIININNKLYISNYNEFKFNYINTSSIQLNMEIGDVINTTTSNYTEEYKVAIACGKTIEQFKSYLNGEYIHIKKQRRENNNTYYTQDGYSSKFISQGAYPSCKFVNLAYYLSCTGNLNIVTPKVNVTFGYVQHTPGSSTPDKELVPATYTFNNLDPFETYIFVGYAAALDAGVMADNKAYTANVVVMANRLQIEAAQTGINSNGKNLLSHADTRLYYFTDPYEWESNTKGKLGMVNYNHTENLNNSFHYYKFNTLLRVNDTNIRIMPTNNMNKNIVSNLDVTTINTSLNRYNITSLLQGEIYDFYIHFINKYGEISDGFRLQNNNEYKIIVDGVDTGKYGAMIRNMVEDGDTYVWVFNRDDNVFRFNSSRKIYTWDDNNYIVNNTYILINKNGNKLNCRKNTDGLLPNLALGDIDDRYKSWIKWGDLCDYLPTNKDVNYPLKDKTLDFIQFVNSNGDKLFKVPRIGTFSTSSGGNRNVCQLRLHVDINSLKAAMSSTDFRGYFISACKLEKTYKSDGFGFLNKYMTNALINDTNYSVGDILEYFTIDKSGINKNNNLSCVYTVKDLSNFPTETYGNEINTISYADNGQDNRAYRESIVRFKDDKNEEDTTYIMYIRSKNINKNIYISNNKVLYRYGNIFGINDLAISIENGLNGRYGSHIAIKYGDKEHGVKTITTDYGKIQFGNTYLFEMYDFYEDEHNIRYFNEIPYNYYPIAKNSEHDMNAILNDGTENVETFYDVIQSLTFIKYKLGNIYDTVITYYTPNINNNYINEFNNTIYRSNVISDEGRVNNWRYFESNAYKNINENKGFITNLVHIGKYLYVHTQHSLFAFNNDAALEMNNKNLQVATPDLFDTEYSEAYLTNLGYGGLQDKESSIVGTFGYIYYNRDNNEIIKIYSTEKKIITDDIKTLFNNLNIKRVMFMNDSVNNRVFIQITHQYTTPLPTGKYKTHTQYIVLSYNYKVNKFISLHSTLMEPITQEYAKNGDVNELNVDSFRYAVNTKDTLYMFNKDEFVHSLYKFGKGYNNLNKVSIIFNRYYDTIKYVEYLVYKLRKTNNVVNDAFNFNRLPVEKEDIPYSGVGIRIYNDLVDTGWIDVRQANTSYKDVDNTVDNYSKPYYQLGNWMFNFIRTESITDSEGNVIPTRLFGNYFVVEFSFGINTEKIEFEFTDLVTSKDKRI